MTLQERKLKSTKNNLPIKKVTEVENQLNLSNKKVDTHISDVMKRIYNEKFKGYKSKEIKGSYKEVSDKKYIDDMELVIPFDNLKISEGKEVKVQGIFKNKKIYAIEINYSGKKLNILKNYKNKKYQKTYNTGGKND